MNKVLEETIRKVQHVEKLLAIKGVGSVTIAGFIAEVGDIRRFKSPKQIQKYAGLELVENSSRKHKKIENQQARKKKTQKDLVSGNDTVVGKEQRVSNNL